MKTLLILTALLLSACQSTLPPGSAISGTSGKNTVTVEVGGLKIADALKKVGLALVNAGGGLVADYAIATLKAKLDSQPNATPAK